MSNSVFKDFSTKYLKPENFFLKNLNSFLKTDMADFSFSSKNTTFVPVC